MSYSRFKKYALHHSEHYWGDLVHNVWLRYFDKTGKDLFKEKLSKRWIFKVIRNEFINSLYGQDRFDPILKVSEDGDEEEFILDTAPSIEENMIYCDLADFVKGKIRRFLEVEVLHLGNHWTLEERYKLFIDIFEMMRFNYTNREIAEQLNITDQQVGTYRKQIVKAITFVGFTNPFNGSALKVARILTLPQWKRRLDGKKFEMEDSNESFELYKHKETGEGFLVKLNKEI